MIAVYARVSTEEQALHGYSLASQVQACRDKAESPDILEYVDEGISGEFLDRPALSKLRDDLKDGLIDKVICYDPDRLSRKLMNSLIVAEEIEKRAELMFVNGDYERTPEGRLFFQMRGSFSEFEKAKILERTSRGRRQKAKQGKVVKDYQIYGYDYDAEDGKHVVNEREAAIVRLIFDLVTGNRQDIKVKGVNGIAHYLTEIGVPTKRQRGQGIWHRQVVRQILMNHVYKGQFYQNRWNTEGMLANKFADTEQKVKMVERPREEWILVPSPVIIHADQFDYAQKLIGESRRRYAGAEKHSYFLSGLIRCGDCGNTMTGRRSKNWGTHVREYVDVKNTAGTKHKGCGNKVKCDDLDEAVWHMIVERFKASREIAATAEEVVTTFEEVEIDRIDREVDRLKKQRERLLTLILEDDGDLQDDYKARLKQTKEQESELVEQKARLEQQLAERHENQFASAHVEDVRERFFTKHENEYTMEERQQLIRDIVREIRVYRNDSIELIGI